MDAELKAQLEALKRRVGDEKIWQIGGPQTASV